MQLDKLVTALGIEKCDEVPFLIEKAKQLKVSRPSYLIMILILLTLTMMLIGIARSILIKIMTIGYPLFQTITIVENQTYSECKQWLAYWLIVTILHLLDDCFYWILYYLPYYHFFKFLFIIALFHPNIRFAEKFYDVVIHKCYEKFQLHVNGRRIKKMMN